MDQPSAYLLLNVVSNDVYWSLASPPTVLVVKLITFQTLDAIAEPTTPA